MEYLNIAQKFLSENPVATVVLIPAIIAWLSHAIKKDVFINAIKKLDRFDKVFEGFGIAGSKIGARWLGFKNWSKIEESALPTLCEAFDMLCEKLKGWALAMKRGFLKDNVREMVKKNLEATDIFIAAQEALAKMNVDKIVKENKK